MAPKAARMDPEPECRRRWLGNQEPLRRAARIGACSECDRPPTQSVSPWTQGAAAKGPLPPMTDGRAPQAGRKGRRMRMRVLAGSLGCPGPAHPRHLGRLSQSRVHHRQPQRPLHCAGERSAQSQPEHPARRRAHWQVHTRCPGQPGQYRPGTPSATRQELAPLHRATRHQEAAGWPRSGWSGRSRGPGRRSGWSGRWPWSGHGAAGRPPRARYRR